jgi:hypothetical protein
MFHKILIEFPKSQHVNLNLETIPLLDENLEDNYRINKEGRQATEYDSLECPIKNVQEGHHIMKAISSTDVGSLEIILRKTSPETDLTTLTNIDNGYTLLHLAVFKDSDRIVYLLWRHIMEKKNEPVEVRKMKMKNWINK